MAKPAAVILRYRNQNTNISGVIETDTDMRADVLDVLAGMYDADADKLPVYDKPPFILDIGANVGAFAAWASAKWPGCSVDCYEPHPDNMRLLFKNTAHLPLVRHYLAAVADKAGELHLSIGKNGCCHTLYGNDTHTAAIPVRCIAAATLPPCDVLKVDTEGAELGILRNYPHLHTCGQVSVEYHNRDEKWELGTILLAAGMTCVREITDAAQNPNCGILTFARKK